MSSSVTRNLPLWGSLATSLCAFLAGYSAANHELVAIGGIGGAYLLLRYVILRRQAPEPKPEPVAAAPVAGTAAVVSASNVGDLVGQMLDEHRYALLLRPQVAGNLGAEQLAAAREQLDQQMALVPEGRVMVGDASSGVSPQTAFVEALYLDRYPVTNRQFVQFVRAGGYAQMAIWDAEVWPAIFEFIDLSGSPGPRFWRDGRYPEGEESYPVVGISWYEASAYARWVGKRLPTDAEWLKAATWPIAVAATNCVQRRYPWGETMDTARTNIWSSGRDRVAPVGDYPNGGSVGGVYDLTGNVWEWTAGDFQHEADERSRTAMKNLRGGAFDTYFENQAACQFVSGESPLGRRHNIGFRCAIGVCDLGSLRGGSIEPETVETVEEELCV